MADHKQVKCSSIAAVLYLFLLQSSNTRGFVTSLQVETEKALCCNEIICRSSAISSQIFPSIDRFEARIERLEISITSGRFLWHQSRVTSSPSIDI
jgi:hypothetical protein